MNSLTANNITKLILTLLVVGIFGFYSASIFTMNHAESMGAMPRTFSSLEHCAKSLPAEDCVTYHLGLLHNLSEIGHNNAVVQISIALFSGLTITLFGLCSGIRHAFLQLRSRYRQLSKKTISAFFYQMGFWLLLFEKRDPSYVFAMA